jgi:hypothetical protein
MSHTERFNAFECPERQLQGVGKTFLAILKINEKFLSLFP